MNEGLATDGPRRIVDHRALDDRHRLLTLAADDALAGFRPGQFVMLSCGDGLVLRRPFSLQRSTLCDGVRGVEILYRVVGKGTAALASLTPGADVTVLGPLGRPFDPPPAGTRPVLLGGGVGIPPMVALAEALLATADAPPLVIGGVSGVRDRACLEGLRRLPLPVAVATLDGSEGIRGTVLDALDGAGTDLRDARPQLYACGPIPMLAAVAARAREIGAVCQVSVEALMGCGYGACVGCAVPRSKESRARGAMRWALACKDGPVFDAGQLDLDGMEEPGG